MQVQATAARVTPRPTSGKILSGDGHLADSAQKPLSPGMGLNKNFSCCIFYLCERTLQCHVHAVLSLVVHGDKPISGVRKLRGKRGRRELLLIRMSYIYSRPINIYRPII
jgi:hypothetical protein